MRIILSEFMSLDGVVQAPGGPEEDTDGGFAHGGWSHPFFDPEVMGGAFADAMTEAEALLFGRRTWQTMAAAWPDEPATLFADQMNAIPKYVVSATPGDDELRWRRPSGFTSATIVVVRSRRGSATAPAFRTPAPRCC